MKTLLLLLLLASSALASPRFALVVGNNVGAQRRPKLWYAERDAARVARALTELGDFPAENVTLLRGASATDVRDALRALEARASGAKPESEKTLLLIYYSGHANSYGLELGSEQLGFEELRASVAGSRADVRVAIVDACDSGALTQVKGGRAVSTLNFPLPGDDQVAGTAFVASTSLGELAQESATLEGSFFTHHLEVGLRGAADADADGRVTLNEAFRYTSARTISGTLETEAGAQHPTYEMKMSGRGDVVLTDTRRAEARLQLPPAPGTLYVLRGPRGLTAEVRGASSALVLALPAGPYRVERRGASARDVSELELEAGQLHALPSSTSAPYLLGRPKGGESFSELFVGATVTSGMNPNFGAALGGRAAFQQRVGSLGLRLRVDFARQGVLDGELAYALYRLGASFSTRWRLRQEWPRIELGPELGGAWVHQSIAGVTYHAAEGTGGAGGQLSIPVGPFRLAFEVSGGARVFRLNEVLSLRPSAEGALLLGAEL